MCPPHERPTPSLKAPFSASGRAVRLVPIAPGLPVSALNRASQTPSRLLWLNRLEIVVKGRTPAASRASARPSEAFE